MTAPEPEDVSSYRQWLEQFPLPVELAVRLFALWPARWPGQLRYLRSWYRSIAGHPTGDEPIPWLPYELIDWLEQYCSSDQTIFEYGSGNSTRFFSKRVGTVYSVEHDPGWYRTVQSKTAGDDSAHLYLREPVNSGPNPARSSDKSPFEGLDFTDYVETILNVPTESFDLVLVDGRARADCVRTAAPHVRSDGVLILDDAQRPRYRSVRSKLREAWDEPEIFDGLKPGCKGRAVTEVYRKP